MKEDRDIRKANPERRPAHSARTHPIPYQKHDEFPWKKRPPELLPMTMTKDAVEDAITVVAIILSFHP